MHAPIIFCGQQVTNDQIKLIVQVTQRFKRLSRNELLDTLCELLEWERPSGRLKNYECSALLDTLQQRGLIALPEPHRTTQSTKTKEKVKENSLIETVGKVEHDAINCDLRELQPIFLKGIESVEERHLWRYLVVRHHYLGYTTAFGAQLRYFIRSEPKNCILGAIQFSSPAWRVQPRDTWIGWNDDHRLKHLQCIVNNSRFLLLPHVRVKNLASHVLALALKRVVQDWREVYNLELLMAETFVDVSRFTGHCYRAANWIDVGETTGRGRQDRYSERHGASVKRILMYPLVPNVQQRVQQLD